MNDTLILYIIAGFFIILGGLIPIVESTFQDSSVTQSTATIEGNLPNELTFQEDSPFDIPDLIFSILGMFTWTFGNVPFLFDLIILTPLRITFYFLILRQMPFVGSS